MLENDQAKQIMENNDFEITQGDGIADKDLKVAVVNLINMFNMESKIQK